MGAGVYVSDLSLNDALAELLSVITATPQSADMNMTCSMFAAFTSADSNTAVKTAVGLAVICKLVTERLWPVTSADGAPYGGMHHLERLILLPAPQGPPSATSTPRHQSQQPSTPPPQEIGEHGDGTLGRHPRDEPTDTNTDDTSGAGATLLTMITPARQVGLSFSIYVAWRVHELLGRLATFHALAKRWLRSFLCQGRTHRGT